jgi:hypothetical protein
MLDKPEMKTAPGAVAARRPRTGWSDRSVRGRAQTGHAPLKRRYRGSARPAPLARRAARLRAGPSRTGFGLPSECARRWPERPRTSEASRHTAGASVQHEGSHGRENVTVASLVGGWPDQVCVAGATPSATLSRSRWEPRWPQLQVLATRSQLTLLAGAGEIAVSVPAPQSKVEAAPLQSYRQSFPLPPRVASLELDA